jgi:hypothetical protein
MAPPPTSTKPLPPAHPAAAQPGAYTEEVDALFHALGRDAAPSGSVSPAEETRSESRAMTYTIPRVTRDIPEADARATEGAAYRDNLETCLDGRFPAFCDHGWLDAFDAARVREAEYQANLVTCKDPVWQHLCRHRLLSGNTPLPAPAAAPIEPQD